MARGRYVYVRARRDEKLPNSQQKGVQWSEEKRMEALTTFIATGSLVMTETITKVPLITLKLWKKSDWWQEYMRELQEEANTKLSKKLDSILEKSIESVEDRLENGDFNYDVRTGKTIRIPAKLRDVHRVTADLIEKKAKLVQLIKPPEEKGVTADHLVELAKAFAAMAGKQVNEPQPIIHEGNYEEVLEDFK
jgi:hypothetical protein